MPLMTCGVGGYKWGGGGTCFAGPGARSRAVAVGQATQAAERPASRKGLTKGGLFAKDNTRGTPKKKGAKKGRPFGESYEDFFDRRQALSSTRDYR